MQNITYDFELDIFQKDAIKGLDDGKHVLITAHTGSGKTLPAEYAIQKFCQAGKKVIYTGPVKSLSNQKFHDFSNKFPSISFGIMTGDIKFNPEADCVIMTTEILRNALYNEDSLHELAFELDINQVACVIFDEVHYINDEHRGKVWEESIMKMPEHIQMLMLSATIDKEKDFASWISKMKNKDVVIASTKTRVVPLKHYMYYITNTGFDKQLSRKPSLNDVDLKQLHSSIHGNFKLIDSDISIYNSVRKIDDYIQKNRLSISKKHVLNSVVKKLFDMNMTPAICFVFSRKNVEYYASLIEMSLFNEDESHYPSIVEKECRKILMKFPNYMEYLGLNEYQTIIDLLKKGIAIHHSGILPVLREMIELLFTKGFIKLLFATETFSVGINMPTKTVLFTGLSKFSGSSFRNIYPHEYTQMAGRAGRRGLDKIGHVIHLNNMFTLPEKSEYKTIMSGKSQALVSKLNITPKLALKLFENIETTMESEFMKSSLNYFQIKKLIHSLVIMNDELSKEIITITSTFHNHSIDINRMYEYCKKESCIQYANNKKRRVIERELTAIKDEYPKTFDKFIKLYRKYNENAERIDDNKVRIERLYNTIDDDMKIMFTILSEHGLINDKYKLTTKGIIASNMNEVNGLLFAEVIEGGLIDNIQSSDLIAILASFANVKYEGESDIDISLIDRFNILPILKSRCEYYYDLFIKKGLYVDENDYTMNSSISAMVMNWANICDEQQSLLIIHECHEKGIFIGEFVKALLKIVNIANELRNVAKLIHNTKLEHICSEIPEKLLKFVATNQSLYV